MTKPQHLTYMEVENQTCLRKKVRNEHSHKCAAVCVCDLHAPPLSLHSLLFYHLTYSTRAPITLRCVQVEREEGAMRNWPVHTERESAFKLNTSWSPATVRSAGDCRGGDTNAAMKSDTLYSRRRYETWLSLRRLPSSPAKKWRKLKSQ